MLPDARASVEAAAESGGRFAALALVTAVAEELLFRGAVLDSVAVARGALIAVVVSSVIFGLHHVSFGLPAILGKSVAGALWAGLMLLSELILVPILSHLAFQGLVSRRMRRTAA
jgi:membrane protease YdiL (CAAX protease family)